MVKFGVKLKKVGKTTRPLSYDLNQISYIIQWKWQVASRDYIWYTKCLKNYGCRFITSYRRHGPSIPKRKKCKKAQWLSEEALQIAAKRRDAKGKGEKERSIHLNAECPRLARRDKKGFLNQIWKRHMHPNVHRSTVYNSQDMEAT